MIVRRQARPRRAELIEREPRADDRRGKDRPVVNERQRAVRQGEMDVRGNARRRRADGEREERYDAANRQRSTAAIDASG